jgi:hypothetical protein
MRDADGDKVIPMTYILPFVVLFVGGVIWLHFHNQKPAEAAPITQLDNSKTLAPSQSQTSSQTSSQTVLSPEKKSVVGLWVDNTGTWVWMFNANGTFTFANLGIDSFYTEGTWLEESEGTLKLTSSLNGGRMVLPFSWVYDWLVLVMPKGGEKITLHKITPAESVVIDARIKQLMKR